ncbi:Fatty acid synthase [Merluccius polli]|uniref:Fatty acid synthase n=1 Tax=Merluccius polli TaxID=89951 RepID=A0AA47N5D8_MERPO|nr:Fatty acid synthase [Merluccius polli]
MALFLKNVAFHGILLDALFEEGNREWEEVSELLKEGIASAVVQPLKTTVFQRDRVEDAFRYMAQGKHIGKVLLQVGPRSEPTMSQSPKSIVASPILVMNSVGASFLLTDAKQAAFGGRAEPRMIAMEIIYWF